MLSTGRTASSTGAVVAAPVPIIEAVMVVTQAQLIVGVSAFVVVATIIVPATMAVGAVVQVLLSVFRQISVQLELKQMIDGRGTFFGSTALTGLLVRGRVAFHVWFGEVGGVHPTVMFGGQPFLGRERVTRDRKRYEPWGS